MGHEIRERGGLVRTQGVNGAQSLRAVVLQQDRRTLSLEIAEIGAMLAIARKLGQPSWKVPRNLRRVSEPWVFVGLESSQAVANDDRPPCHITEIGTGPMQGRA